MYPQRELTRLAEYEAALRRDIAIRRTQCAEAAGRVTRPFEWLGRAMNLWRRLSASVPFALIPLGLLAQRTLLPRRKVLGTLLRWGPVIFSAVRSFRTAPSRGGPQANRDSVH